MSASSPHKAPHELRTLVKDYLVTEDFPDGWVEPEEISDQAAPDLILARELWSLIEQFEAVEGALRGLLEMHCDCECSFHEDAYRVLEEVDKWRIFTRMNVT